MVHEALSNRIGELVRKRGVSERKFLLSAGLDLSTIKRIRNRGQIPSAQILAKLEAALGCPHGYLLELVVGRPAPAAKLELSQIFVRGFVQAGLWDSALEWPEADWFPVTAPVSHGLIGAARFGLLVRGDSMDRLYPDGTVVICVRFTDLGRGPRPGERVVVIRRMRGSSDYEATLKEYEVDRQGRHVLWPRSSNPDHQSPIILAAGEVPIEATPGAELPADGGEPDVAVHALVIGSYRPEPVVGEG